LKIREINAKITLSHSDFHRYKIKGFSEAQDFLNERAVDLRHVKKEFIWWGRLFFVILRLKWLLCRPGVEA
jgi:hypothetical protein